jgi:hypothetical protein
MKDISPQRFGLMGKLHNAISKLIDTTELTPSEVLTVLAMISRDIEHLVMAKVGVTREKK